MFEFAWPWVFALLPLPLLIYFLVPPNTRQETALRVPFFQQLAGMQQQGRIHAARHWLQQLLLVLIWLCCVAAAARPQWVGEPVQLPATGRDLLLAVDISGSMETPDMVFQNRNLQRIDVVKFVVSDFVRRRENDRLGLILFGTNAYLQAPLTFDRTTVQTLLQEAQLGFAGQQTAIGDAIGLAIKRLRERPESSRVLILLSDGANTAGEVDPRHAADLARLAGVKIYTIGLGADEMIQQTLFGRRKVNPSADLDEETMTYIADKTGGQYFRARNPEELIRIYAELDRLEPIEQEEDVFRPISALFYWPLAAALLGSFLLALIRVFSGVFQLGSTNGRLV
ncbi:VWA domain-containing protein [Saccharophagus sp. K07]|jgi:Ca-activated chloride channel family protein|uniref:vWA domain-containing protein n=1 Tax=Saccharophagus sp. K07 TaxID=2283636 RepID=UPI001651CA1C|nr:VWA domain-containing protein [Saccharophagus sp. K07]MBC6904805.1 VWA domain-containing protein [Saccharophagus sp. K07]